MTASPQAFFLDLDGHQRFCLFHPAHGEHVRGRVVYIHPFAEEMNKARRMAALQSRALAAAGFGVLQIDLLGCGDSGADFGDASWDRWVRDVLAADGWLQKRDERYARAPLWLWGLRAGCLLATAAAEQIDGCCNFCFWQPPASGRVLLQQFMRLRLAADLLSGANKGAMEAMRRQLAAGESVEIAGYLLAPELARGLELAQLNPPPNAGRLEWFELSTTENAALLPVSEQTLQRWATAGLRTHTHLVQGPQFWSATEIEDAPKLIDATTSALRNEPQTEGGR